MGSKPDVFAHIVHQADKVTGNASYAANGFQAIVGLQAYRSYEWMTLTAPTNSAGNFRGMVVSARWATSYQVFSKAADAVGTVATVASIASNSVDMAPQFEAVYRSNESMAIKSLKYTSLAGTVAQKTLMGIITGGVHLIYLPLLVSCSTAKGGGENIAVADVCEVVKNADTYVQSSANYVTDPANQQKVLQTVVSIFIK